MQGQSSDFIADDEIAQIRQLCECASTEHKLQEVNFDLLLELVPRLLDALQYARQQHALSCRRIPVGEQLPIPGQQVLCFMVGRTPFVGWMTKIYTWMPCPHNEGHPITHWSPLPPSENGP